MHARGDSKLRRVNILRKKILIRRYGETLKSAVNKPEVQEHTGAHTTSNPIVS